MATRYLFLSTLYSALFAHLELNSSIAAMLFSMTTRPRAEERRSGGGVHLRSGAEKMQSYTARRNDISPANGDFLAAASQAN